MDKNKLSELINKSLTAKEIAKKLHVSESTVWRCMKSLGLKTDRSWTHDTESETKTCIRCGETRDISKFPSAGNKSNQGKYRRRYCETCYNKAKEVRRQKMRSWFEGYKKTLKCEKCGIEDYRVLEFHHKNDDKESDVSTVVSNARWSKEKIMEEIGKCSVLCANCHRILHYIPKSE